MDIDDCLTNDVGAFGRYQISTCLIVSLYLLSYAGFTILPVLVAANVSEVQKVNDRVHNDSSILYEWNLLDETWISDTIQALYFAGFLIGVVVLGQLSDKFGRKPVIKIGFLLLFPLCLSTSLSSCWEMFAVFRFFTGFLFGGVGLVAYVYMQEITGRQWWAVSAAVQGVSFPLGIFVFALFGYLVPPWRSLIQMLSVIQIPTLIYVMFLNESPRWLYSQNCIKEAENGLAFIAKRNGVKSPVCRLKPLVYEKVGNNPTIFSVLKNRVTLHRLLVMAFVWFVNSFVYYALTLAVGELGNNVYATTALSGLVEFPIHVGYPWFLNRQWCGRRRGVCLSMLLAGFSCLILMAFTPQDASKIKLALGLIGKMSVAFSFSSIYVYTPELFPTNVRNVATGTASMFARVGGILSSFAKSFIHLHTMVAYLTYGCFGILGGLLVLALPETLGRTPPNSFMDLQNDFDDSQTEFIALKSSKRGKYEKLKKCEDDDEDAL